MKTVKIISVIAALQCIYTGILLQSMPIAIIGICVFAAIGKTAECLDDKNQSV